MTLVSERKAYLGHFVTLACNDFTRPCTRQGVSFDDSKPPVQSAWLGRRFFEAATWFGSIRMVSDRACACSAPKTAEGAVLIPPHCLPNLKQRIRKGKLRSVR
jgi:hypothetical protein